MQVPSAVVLEGDALEVMREMESDSVDALCCDPPAGINFMNKAFDSDRGGRDQWIAWLSEIMAEALRVCKPGAHGFVWALPRTSHWTMMALEDAGWQIREVCHHIFGSGFPKSANPGKQMYSFYDQKQRAHGRIPTDGTETMKRHMHLGTAMKPAVENWILVRKPIEEKNIALQVLSNGCGAINIDGCRVQSGEGDDTRRVRHNNVTLGEHGIYGKGVGVPSGGNPGRFPSNLWLSHIGGPNGCRPTGEMKRVKAHWSQPTAGGKMAGMDTEVYGSFKGSENGNKPCGYANPDGTEEVETWICARDEDGNYLCPVALLDLQSGPKSGAHGGKGNFEQHAWMRNDTPQDIQRDNKGGASRFFQQFHPDTHPGFIYQAKSSRRERNLGLEGMPEKPIRDSGNEFGKMHMWNGENGDEAWKKKNPNKPSANTHPTVKSLALCDYLVRLITPPGGTCLDPFAGSGSTGCSAVRQGFNFIGIEKEPEYVEIARKRIAYWSQPEEVRARDKSKPPVGATAGCYGTETPEGAAKRGRKPRHQATPVQSPEDSNRVESDEDYPGALPMCPICKDAPIASGRGVYQCGHNLYYEDEMEALKETLF